MSDEITLVLPAEQDFRHIAHLVVAGLGARLDLTLERLEDLQVAIDAVLGCRDDEGDVSVTVRVDNGIVRAEVGPFPQGALDELEGDDSGLGLRRVLETVCDSFEVETRDGGSWVELTKSAAAPEPAGA
jgi:anti-sigma regulatory factor (Ser/Thr protein kinase)